MALRQSGGTMAAIEAQKIVFSASPRRLAVMGLSRPAAGGTSLATRVHRNHAAEHVLDLSTRFGWPMGLDLSFEYSTYDDSLSFFGIEESAVDIEMIWIDVSRLQDLPAEELASFMEGRVRQLRALTPAPIMVVDIPAFDERAARVNAALEATCREVPSVVLAPLSEVATMLGTDFFASESQAATGSSYGGKAQLLLAQRFGLSWLGSLAVSPLRALAVDLDNTLYDGVLGEDGLDGIVMNDEHLALQADLLNARSQGIFLAVVSKNEQDDVMDLLATDRFAIGPNDVDFVAASWGAKAEAIERAAERFNISPETFLFIDDNLGELMGVSARLPAVHLGWAGTPEETRAVLALYPGMKRFHRSSADELRLADASANEDRARIRETASDPLDYLKSLELTIDINADDGSRLARAAELLRKTNQFTTSLSRLPEGELAALMGGHDGCVVTVDLKDRFTDSGTIAVVVARRTDEGVLVDDIAVSCRALGRGVDATFLDAALAEVGQRLDASSLKVRFEHGPRNGPAMSWLGLLSGTVEGSLKEIPVPNRPSLNGVAIIWPPRPEA